MICAMGSSTCAGEYPAMKPSFTESRLVFLIMAFPADDAVGSPGVG